MKKKQNTVCNALHISAGNPARAASNPVPAAGTPARRPRRAAPFFAAPAAALLCLFTTSPLRAFETGLLLDQELRFTGSAVNKPAPEGTNILSPPVYDLYYHGNAALWFSLKTTKTSALFLKASFDALLPSIVKGNYPAQMLPALDEAEFSFFPARIFTLNLGRVLFKDPQGMIADGSFDGGNILFSFAGHSIKLGAFYTGLLTKKEAKILISPEERDDYFNGGYFAPPHFVFSALYDYVSKDERKNFSLNVIRQEDLREDTAAQNIWVLPGISFAPVRDLNFNLTGIFCTASGSAGTTYSAAARLSAFYIFDLYLPSRAGLGINLLYGGIEKPQAMPVLNKTGRTGHIYDPEETRLLFFNAQYLANINTRLSIGLDFAMFFRLDTDFIPAYQIFSAFENPRSDNPVLGEEFVFTLIHNLFSDISVKFGSGLFFPCAGDGKVYTAAAPVQWDIRLALLISL